MQLRCGGIIAQELEAGKRRVAMVTEAGRSYRAVFNNNQPNGSVSVVRTVVQTHATSPLPIVIRLSGWSLLLMQDHNRRDGLLDTSCETPFEKRLPALAMPQVSSPWDIQHLIRDQHRRLVVDWGLGPCVAFAFATGESVSTYH